MLRIASCFFILLCACTSFAQQHTNTNANDDYRFHQPYVEKSISLLTGYKYYGRSAVEIGIAYKSDMMNTHHPGTSVVYFSTEMFYDGKMYFGPKIGVWAGGGMAGMMMGVSMVYYTNFETSSLRIHPEIGMGFGNFRIYYARNLPVTGKQYRGINRNMFGLNVLIDLKKRKVTPYDKEDHE